MASKEGFPFFSKELKMSSKDLIMWLKSNEKLENRPLASRTTRELFEKLIRDRKKEAE